MNIDMTKTQAESLYRGAINNKNELKERLFDEFIAKLKTESKDFGPFIFLFLLLLNNVVLIKPLETLC